MTFVIGAYQAVERPGAGQHAAPVGLWRGEDLRTIDEVAMTVLPVDCLEVARAGVEQVRAIRHPHLLPVIDVVADDDRVAVVCPWPRGGRLSELLARRGRLTPAETMTVLLPLADTLSAAHANGYAHGGVGPESIWFDGAGRPLLGALAVGRIIADLNGGLPAICRDVAPEVVRGDPVAGAAAAAADVFSLGSVALFCLTGRSAWPADDPVDVLVQSAAGLWPDPPDDGGPALLINLIRAMLLDDPPNRPSAAAITEELAVIGEPAAIEFGSGPAPAAASADRWRGWSAPLSPGSAPPDGPRMVQPAQDGDHRAGVDPDVDDAAGTDAPADAVGGPAVRRLRARLRSTPAARAQLLTRAPVRPAEPDGPARPTALAKVGIALLCGLLLTLVAVQAIAWSSGQDDPAASSAAGQPADPNHWSAVIAELDEAREAALAQADPSLLDAVYTDDAPGRSSDEATIAQLAAQSWHVTDAVHQISEVVPLEPPSGGSTDNQLRLAVVDTLPARPVVDDEGRQVGMTAARAAQRRIFLLRPTEAGYRISDIQPG